MFSDPFLDRTLLYQEDGKDYKVKLTNDEVKMIVKSRSVPEIVAPLKV